MHLLETGDGRLLVKRIPKLGKNTKIEVLVSEAGDGGSTVVLRGWFFGMGKSQVHGAVADLRQAIEEHSKPGS